MHLQVVWMQKLSDFPYVPSASAPHEPPGETFTT